jgi:uncharacterized protein (UPF0276 family)
MIQKKTTRPRLRPWGVGLAYRFCIHQQVMRSAAMLDFVEIPVEDYVYPDRRAEVDPDESLLDEVTDRLPAVAHGNHMSVGSAQLAEPTYRDEVEQFVARTAVAEYSDHLSWTHAGDVKIDCFIAIPFTDLGVATATKNAQRMQRRLGVPLLLENVTYQFPIPQATMKEHEFITRVVEGADCGIMLDVTNVFINAKNHGYNAYEFIKSLPADRIGQAHFCGVERDRDGLYIDTHHKPTSKGVWDLIEHALEHTALRALILERDRALTPFAPLLDEIWTAKSLFLKHRPAAAPASFDRAVTHSPDLTDDGADDHAEDLKCFQQTLARLLLEPALAGAIDREGETALKHTGLGRDERRVLAAIPVHHRDKLSEMIRSYR